MVFPPAPGKEAQRRTARFARGQLAPSVRGLTLSALDLAAAACGFSVYSLLLRSRPDDGGADELVLSATRGRPAHLVGRVRVPHGAPIAGRVAATGEPAYQLPAAARTPTFDRRTGYRTDYFVVVPVRRGRETDGVLCLADPSGGAEDSERLLRQAELAADHVGQVLALGNEYERVESLALLDSLTRLYNRRFLDSYLPTELSRAGRNGQPLTVAMLDLDGFKRVNDTYGHAVGDQVLREAAELLTTVVRRQDVLARYGGDEFAVIMPGSGRAVSEAVLKRVMRRFDEHPFRVDDGRAAVKVSLSAGLATYPHDADSAPELLVAADRALYRSRRGTYAPAGETGA